MSEPRLGRRRIVLWTMATAFVVVAAILAASACSSVSHSGASPADAGSERASADSSAPSSSEGGLGSDGARGSDAGVASDGAMSSGAFAAADSPIESDSGQSKDAGDGGRSFSTDRSMFFGASRCADAGVQLCEDFETGIVDTTTWTVAGTAPVIDGVQAARGAKALHITRNGNGLSYIKESKTFPEVNDAYFGRVFVYFKSLPIAPLTYAHWTMLAASGTGVSGETRVSGQFSSGKNLFGVGTDNRVDDAGTGDWTTSDDDPTGMPNPVPIGQWLCIEWMHKGNTNETRFYWDDTEHPSLYTTATMHGGNANPYILPQFTNVWVGWQEYQTTTESFELWIDEIAIDAERIGCVL